jgi:hypothetical protein
LKTYAFSSELKNLLGSEQVNNWIADRIGGCRQWWQRAHSALRLYRSGAIDKKMHRATEMMNSASKLDVSVQQLSRQITDNIASETRAKSQELDPIIEAARGVVARLTENGRHH